MKQKLNKITKTRNVLLHQNLEIKLNKNERFYTKYLSLREGLKKNWNFLTMSATPPPFPPPLKLENIHFFTGPVG